MASNPIVWWRHVFVLASSVNCLEKICCFWLRYKKQQRTLTEGGLGFNVGNSFKCLESGSLLRINGSIHCFDWWIRFIDSVPLFDSWIQFMDSTRKRRWRQKCSKTKMKTKNAKPFVLPLHLFGLVYGTYVFEFSGKKNGNHDCYLPRAAANETAACCSV